MHSDNNKECAVMLRESALADRGELAGPLTHEINNLLNMLTLHLALVQQKSPADLTPDVLAIRQHVSQAADVVLRFQRYGGKNAPESTMVDLNSSLRRWSKPCPTCRPMPRWFWNWIPLCRECGGLKPTSAGWVGFW